jgi:NAD(P)-dependent dehydrogenase (short-subunit alcohol dehydrogenase family)
MTLSGKTVLLTGALGSLGRAQAQTLARAGARLYLLDRPEHDKAASFTASIPGATYIGQDLGSLAATEKRIADLIAENGPIDVLINNAALIINKPFQDFSLEEYEEQLRVNAAAAFALIRAVAPAMKTKGAGRIINFCSITLNGGWEGYVPYVTSKGAMLGMTKSLARELGPFGITVNAVSPGAVVSEAEVRVFGDQLAAYEQRMLDHQSLKKRIQPEHVADLVLFLASPNAEMISGQNIKIDGGW